MKNTPAAGSFETLPIPQKGIPNNSVVRYRIYKDADNFVIVQAATALEAYESSGVKDAVKIERERLDGQAVLGMGTWKEAVAAAAPVADAPAAAAAPAAEAPAAEKPAA